MLALEPAPRQGTLAARLELLARRSPTRCAFLDGQGGPVATWSDIARDAERWRSLLANGAVVALLADSPVRFSRAYLAAIAAGACVVPLDPRATDDELDRLLGTLRIGDVVLEEDGEQSARLSGAGLRLWGLSSGELRLVQPGRGETRLVPPAGTSVILSTSGTTGAPKLVPLSEPQLLYVASAIVGHHHLGELDRGYCPLPLFHVNAQVVGLLSTLLSGGSLVLERRFDRRRTWEAVEQHGATWLNLVPAILSVLSFEPAPPSSVVERLRFARSASAPLPVPVLRRFEQHTGIGVLETYGLTEAASQVVANPLDPALRRPGSAGKPVGTELRIVDEDGFPVAPGTLGAVELRGSGLIESYCDLHGCPIPARRGGWFRTGDLGRLDEDRFVYLAGRSDDLINRGGELIEPREIEDVLRANPKVAEAVAFARPHPVLGQEPVAAVEVRDGASGSGQLSGQLVGQLLAELEAACARSLTRYKRPVEIRLLEALPKGPTGKVSRRRVADQHGGRVGDQHGAPAPDQHGGRVGDQQGGARHA